MVYILSYMNLHRCAKFGANRPSRLVAFPKFVLRSVRLFAAVRADSRKITPKKCEGGRGWREGGREGGEGMEGRGGEGRGGREGEDF